MATLLRRRDDKDQLNDVTDDIEAKGDTTDGQSPITSSDTSFEELGSKIWLPYLELAEKYDKDLVHNWRDDMDSLLIFAALFSASVTAFVIESYNSLVQDPGEVTISVLLQISQQIANGTHAVAAVRPSFQPATIDVAINILWFLSLAFSLACALAAVLVRQWARQYLRYPRSFSSTSEQARARQFVFENMQWWKMDVIVDMIPALLHISLILFFIGLLLFVRAVSYSLAVYILYFSAIGGATYSILTIIPLIFPACPYKTPFTGFFRLCMTGGTTLFRLVWRCTLVLLATLEVLLLQVISSAARLWLPSFSIQKRERALEISEPVRSAMSRCCNYLCEKRHTIINCNVGTTVTAMATFHPYFHRCLQFWLGRSEKFHNDLSIRDANALRWTMEYSKRDADLFTMVQSVPEFVQLYDSSPNVLDIMRKSGITSQTIRILRLSVGPGNEVTNQAAFVSCLESIISVMPCSTLTIRRSGYQLDDHAWLIHHLLDVSDRTFAMQSSLGSVFLCAISSLILHYTTAIEEEAWVPKVKEPPGHPFNFGFYPHIKWKLFHLCRSWSQYDGLKSLYSAVERIEDLIAYPRILISPSVFSKELQVFRSRWMTSWLTFYMTLSLPHNPLIWKTIRHGATHLQHFPHSTRDSQCAAFAMMDILLRSQPHSWEIAEELSVYSMVLYGGGILYLYRDQRQDLHADFLNRVRVYGSSTHQFMESGGTVVVTYEQYTKILHNHVSSHQQFENDDELEAHARTIKQFIRRRLKEEDADENVNVLLVDAQHLANARALLNSSRSPSTIGNSQIHWAWNDLIYRIARDCGYEPQLWGNYNIEIHAELQFYEQDLVTCTLGSSPPERIECPASIEWSAGFGGNFTFETMRDPVTCALGSSPPERIERPASSEWSSGVGGNFTFETMRDH